MNDASEKHLKLQLDAEREELRSKLTTEKMHESYYYPLWEHMADAHNLILLETELIEIVNAVTLCISRATRQALYNNPEHETKEGVEGHKDLPYLQPGGAPDQTEQSSRSYGLGGGAPS